MRTLLILLLLCSPCYAMMEGVWTGDAYKADSKVLVARAIISVDTETGKTEYTDEKPDTSVVKTTSCVVYNGGECRESEYFKVTIKDIKD